jgi:hypothetical protein
MGLRLLPIAKPCAEPFDAMPGDERKRFCHKCQKPVFNLSARTEAEAREVLSTGERACVRYAKTAAGAILFAAVAGCSAAVPAPATPADWDQGDGIIDVDDKCPDQPGPNDEGCPEPPKSPDGGDRPGK